MSEVIRSMGYTHYWYRPKEIPREIFRRIVDDFKKLLPTFKMLDIPLAGGLGEGEPVINYDEVWFNGAVNCGHKKAKIIIPWPDDEVIPLFTGDPDHAVSGTWFAGHLLKQRTCNGDCSYETFYFPRVSDREPISEKDTIHAVDMASNEEIIIAPRPREIGKVFNCCKTAFRPYDLAVISFLTIAKHYLKDDIIVRTDGKYQHWMDGFYLCQEILGYGKEYTITEKGELVKLAKLPKDTLVYWIMRGDE